MHHQSTNSGYMEIFLLAAGVSLIMIFMDYLTGDKFDIKKYIKFFIVISLVKIYFIFTSCEAVECSNQTFYFSPSALTSDQTIHYQKLLDKHLTDGMKCFEDANKVGTKIPNITDREKVGKVFISTLGMLKTGNMRSKIIASLLITLYQYSLDAFNQWVIMEQLLNYAKYNFEMAEFYKRILSNTIPYCSVRGLA